jgi:transposase
MNVNQNGGYYAAGVPYDMSKKMEVLQAYLDLMRELDPAGANTPKIHAEVVAATAKVSIGYADKVIREYLVSGAIADPRLGKQDLADKRRQFTKIGPEESNVLLALRAEDDQQWLIHYQQKLYAATGVLVGTSTIDVFFKTRFKYKGCLRKAPLVPLDKWKPANIAAFHRFLGTLAKLPNHFKYHFIDEKHIVNKDCYNDRVRADPETGRVRCIVVSGNFREAFNLIGVIRCSGDEPAMHYSLGQENRTSASFTAYVEHLVAINWFQRGDVLIMDNAAIHTGGEATIVADFLWNSSEVVVVPLPTRAPELNPIELIFHILARRLRSYRYRADNAGDMNVPQQVARIVGTISAETALKCAGHCGY